MSQADVDAVRSSIEGFNRGDLEAVVAMCDPAVEWFPPAELPGASAYRGHEGVRAAANDMLEVFGAIQADPEEFIDTADGLVVVLFRWRGRGRESGVSIDPVGRQAAVFTMREGRAVRVNWYVDRAEALQAAGLSR